MSKLNKIVEGMSKEIAAAVKKEPKLKIPKTEKEVTALANSKFKRLKQTTKLLTTAKKKLKSLEKEIRDLSNLESDLDEDVYQLAKVKESYKKKSKKSGK